MFYLVLINKFLYYSLGVLATGGTYCWMKRLGLRPDKLASNELKSHKELKGIIGDDGLKISKKVRLSLKNDFEGCCLLGSTGAYKTSTLFMNNLLENNIPGSFVVPDPKGELYETTSGFQKDICNRKVYKIDLTNPEYSEKYNLLEQCKNTEEVLQLASSLLMNGALSIELASGKKASGVEWIQMSEPLLSSVLLYAKGLDKPYNTIEFALQLILTLEVDRIQNLLESSRNLDALTQFNIFLQVGESERTEGSIKITLATNMKLFTDKIVNKISSDTTFNIEKFRTEASILYIIYPERKSSYLAPFIAPLFSQIIDKLLDNYNSESLPVHLMFDEFGNIGMLNNMSINAATVRSRKISLTICLQSITQLIQVYGINNAKSILNNLRTKMILPGMSDVETINYISSICGNIEVNTKNVQVSKGNESYSYSKTKRKMFEEGELRTLEDKTILIVNSNKMPVLDDIEPYFETDRKNNVMSPVKYKKNKNILYNITRELKRLKDLDIYNDSDKEHDLDEPNRIIRRLYPEKG